MGDVGLQLAAEDFRISREQRSRAVDQSAAIDRESFDREVVNLEAQALPRLIAQFGVQQGTELFNQLLQLLMAALGLTGQVTSPTIGQESFEFGILK